MGWEREGLGMGTSQNENGKGKENNETAKLKVKQNHSDKMMRSAGSFLHLDQL